MQIGKHTYNIGNIVQHYQEYAELIIGSFCSIAPNLNVYLGGNHRTDWVTTYPFGHINQEIFTNKAKGHPKTNGNIIIGNDVWIGSGVTIMSGITIGDGAVIGCNSHIVQDVEPYSIVGGNPGKFYYFRFDQETIKKLLKLKWWNMEDSDINDLIPFLCSNNFEKLFADERCNIRIHN